MPEKHTSRQLCCPYYRPDDKGECLMTRGGLYIPLTAHIEIFCKTVNYSSCPQYVRGLTLIRESFSQHTETIDSRRRFPRIHHRFPLVVSTCDEKGQPVQVIDREAITLDLSLGGVKISSHSEIPVNKILHISFQEDLHHTLVSGIGEVRWSRGSEGPLPFQAGLSFLDKTLPPAIAKQVGLQQ